MRVQLAGWCVLLAVSGGLAADKPKKVKPPPPPPVVEELAKPTEAPKDAPAHQLDRAKPTSDTAFTVTKPVGTWAREANVGDEACRMLLVVTDDRVTLTLSTARGEQTGEVRIDADYAINKESCLFGVIDSCDAKSSHPGDFPEQLKLTGQPFCVRFRVEGDALSFKEFKGFGVELIEERKHVVSLLAAVCGRYTKVDPAKPLPPLKAAKNAATNSDPLLRQDQLLNQSETHGQPGAPVHSPPRPADPPSHLTPSRIHGGILKADPPKDAKTPILPPLKKGEKPVCEEPSDAEVLRVFHERCEKGLGKLAIADVTVVKNLVVDKVDPYRFFPLVGMAQLHRVTWECGVYYNDTREGKRKPMVEVISMNKDRLYLYVGENPDAQREALEMTKWK